MTPDCIMSSSAAAGAEGSAAAAVLDIGLVAARDPGGTRESGIATVAGSPADAAAAGAAAVAGVSADAAGTGAAGAADGALADAPASAPRISTSSGELLEEGMRGGFRVIAENVDGTYTVQVSMREERKSVPCAGHGV